ncbi:MAG: glycosyltransferase family 2 protein [Bacteroidia bacterium]
MQLPEILMKPAPKLSLITVCYQAEKVLEQSLQSAMMQDFQDFEFVIIDGGSKDNTLQIAEKFRNKIGYLISEKDHGIYDAMNKGIKAAKGDWLYFLNAGDSFYHSKVLSSIFEGNKYEKYNFIYGKVQTKNEPTGINYVSGEPVSLKDFYSKYPICHQATFSRKLLFNKIGLFDTKYKLAADTEWFARVFKAEAENCIFIDEIIAFYDIQGTTYHKRMAGYMEYLDFGKKHFPIFVSIKNHLFYPILWVKVKLIRLLSQSRLFQQYRKLKFNKQLASN